MTTQPTEVQPKKRIVAPAKKRVAKKKIAAKKVAAKKTAAKKTTPRAKASTVRVARPRTGYDWRTTDANGFMPGTESATIAALLVKGATSRGAINEQLSKTLPKKTRTGSPKNVPAIVSGVVHRMIHEKGYTIESSWRLVPPAAKKQPAKKK